MAIFELNPITGLLDVVAKFHNKLKNLAWSVAGHTIDTDLDVGDNNITNVADIALDTISSDSGTTVSVTLGADVGDDFVVGNNNSLVVEGDNERVGIGTNAPACKLDVVGDGCVSGSAGIGTPAVPAAIQLGVLIDTLTKVGVLIKAAASQTEDLIRLTDNSNNIVFAVGPDGHVGIGAGDVAGRIVTIADTVAQAINFGIDLLQITNTAVTTNVATQFVARSDHTTGTTANLGGFAGGATINSNGAVTTATGLLGKVLISNGFNPVVTSMIGVQGEVDAEDGTVTQAIGVYGKEPAVDTGSITRNWAGLFEGDVQVNSNKKLILEGSVSAKGDSYLVYNSATTDIDLYVDGVNVITYDNDDIVIKKQLTSSGGRVKNTTRITNTDSPYTILATDHEVFADTDGGAITINLTAGVDGRSVRIVNTGSSGNDVTLTPNGAELLNGVNASETIYDSENFMLSYETTEGWF